MNKTNATSKTNAQSNNTSSSMNCNSCGTGDNGSNYNNR